MSDPLIPPPVQMNQTPPTIVRTTVGVPRANKPGGFWRRFLAHFVDGIIISIALLPITFGARIIAALISGHQTGVAVGVTVLAMLIQWGAQAIAIYFYYGYFYSTKGATPGKMLLSMKVLSSETGTYLTYGQTFLREFVGKVILGALTLGIGYIVAGFREDKKGLHDIVFKTQVIVQEQQ